MRIFDEVTRAPQPEKAVAELSAQQLVQLAQELEPMPETGMPGLVRALVTCAAARRWFAQYGPRLGGKEEPC